MTGLRGTGLLLVCLCGISVNDVEFWNDSLESLVCCWWECVELVLMMWSIVMVGF